MAKDILGEAGLHFDELNKLRVLDPEVTQQTIELKEECKEFVDSECHLGRHIATQLWASPTVPHTHLPTVALGPARMELLAPWMLSLAFLNSYVPPTLSASPLVMFSCSPHMEHQSKQTLECREEGVFWDMPSLIFLLSETLNFMGTELWLGSEK